MNSQKGVDWVDDSYAALIGLGNTHAENLLLATFLIGKVAVLNSALGRKIPSEKYEEAIDALSKEITSAVYAALDKLVRAYGE